MLETIRKVSGSPIVKGVLIAVALTFVFCFGMTDVIRRLMGKDYVAKIGDVKILPAQFKIEKRKKEQFMKKENSGEKEIAGALLHELIFDTIVSTAAEKYGLIVSDETMKRYIAGLSFFQDADGRFNANLLRGFLRKSEISEEMFLESSKKNVKSEAIKAPFAGISITGELSAYASALDEKRSVVLVQIDPKEFRLKILDEPAKDELQEFFSAHTDMFMIDETRTFSLIELKESDLAKKVVITDDELRDAYETSPGRDDRSFDDMKKELEEDLRNEKLEGITNEFCRNIEDDLVAGEDVEKVAKKYNLKVRKVQDVAMKDTETLKVPYATDVFNVAFTLDEGTGDTFSESVNENKERILWIVSVHSIKPKHVASFDNVAAKVKKAWKADKQHQMAIDLADEWKAAGKTKKLADLAEKKDRHAEYTALFGRDGKCIENSKHKDVIEHIYDEVFSLNRGDVNCIELDGKVYIYQIDKIYSKTIEGEQLIKIGRHLTSRIRDDMYQQLVGYLSKEYEVTVNHEALKEMNEEVSPDIDIF